MRRLFGSLVFSFLLAASAQASPCPADGFVKSAGNAFMNAANSGSPQAFTNAASRYADLRSISMFALGQYRRDLPPSREAEYVSLARSFMGRFMAQYASHFNGNSINITSCDASGSGLTVGAKFGGGESITLRLHGGSGSYRVEDLSVSSIWLAQALRSKFTGVIASHGGDVTALLDWLDN
jgi:ABC-type transporter MlaC component